MSSYAYNMYCGWKYNISQREAVTDRNSAGFVWSLAAALVIVFVVAEILSIIDYKIQNQNLNGFTLLEPLRISSVEAAAVARGSIIASAENPQELWLIGPNSGKLHFVGDVDSLKKFIKNFALTVKGKTFSSWKNKAPSSYAGKFVIDTNDLGKMYFVNPTDLKPYYIDGLANGLITLKSISSAVSVSIFKSYKIAADFNKPKTFVSAPASSSASSAPLSSNGIDVKKYCETHIIATPTNVLEQDCLRMQKERAQRVAYYEAINNHQTPPSPVAAPAATTPIIPVAAPPVVTQPAPPTIAAASYGDGPNIRVGIFAETAAQLIKSSQAFSVTDSKGTVLLSVQPYQLLSIDFREQDGLYAYGIGIPNTMSGNYLRLVPSSSNSVFEIVSFENRPGWNKSLNDNTFLGTLELRYNSSKNRTWVINELPMETYLKGLAETSNSSPAEYLKAMAIASRTYATYHLIRGTKHGDEYFTVDATYDQVYKGFGTQSRMPNLATAVEATKGKVVTYGGEVALTPFFSWSDGHTRSMKEVWGVDKPWLQSVAEPSGYSKTTLYGHGVGLSAYGALLLASDKYNYTYDQIIAYYYRGTTLSGNYNNSPALALSP